MSGRFWQNRIVIDILRYVCLLGGVMLSVFCQNPSYSNVAYDPGQLAPKGQFIAAAYSYIEHDDTLVFFTQTCNCVDTTRVPTTVISTYPYNLDGNFLHLYIPRIDTTSPSCTSLVTLNYNRLWGLTLAGGWLYQSVALSIKGTATAADSQKSQAFLTSNTDMYKSSWIDINEKQMVFNFVPDTGKFAASFIAQWKDVFYKEYNASVDRMTSDAVKVTFNDPALTVPDVVNISRNQKREIQTIADAGTFEILMNTPIFTSGGSIKMKQTLKDTINNYTYKDDGSSCPAKMFPDWFTKGLLPLRKRK